VRHRLPVILAVGLAAVLAGARSFAAIGEWVADRLDADLLDRVIGAFLWTSTQVVASRRVIAIDGKTVRGARTANAVAPHLVAAFDHVAGTVLGQVAVAAKSNEIPAVRDLLACFDLTGAVVTVDAMHTQTDTATAITQAGASPAPSRSWPPRPGSTSPAPRRSRRSGAPWPGAQRRASRSFT
jgi:hypothetical protein